MKNISKFYVLNMIYTYNSWFVLTDLDLAYNNTKQNVTKCLTVIKVMQLKQIYFI